MNRSKILKRQLGITFFSSSLCFPSDPGEKKLHLFLFKVFWKHFKTPPLGGALVLSDNGQTE